MNPPFPEVYFQVELLVSRRVNAWEKIFQTYFFPYIIGGCFNDDLPVESVKNHRYKKQKLMIPKVIQKDWIWGSWKRFGASSPTETPPSFWSRVPATKFNANKNHGLIPYITTSVCQGCHPIFISKNVPKGPWSFLGRKVLTNIAPPHFMRHLHVFVQLPGSIGSGQLVYIDRLLLYYPVV